MISRERLAREYINIIDNYYPKSSSLLRHCLVKILDFKTDRTNKYLYYLCIYYPNRVGDRLFEQQDIFKDAAENMGLVEVVFINANRLLRDPRSTLRQQDFRFWLELHWLAHYEDRLF
ncbi:hypothetical protein [Myxosarcina sp. GI1]|uniref:hypothetical protein n=1 Tax=Myxosarcina sp. GI1 TaxID=1541065 RepID=UPI00056290FD|nr:hypothetical protein [Myxosarcina sp. GI1]